MKVTYSNDTDYQYWNFELTCKDEQQFNAVSEFILNEMSFYNISLLGCPAQDQDSYYDCFAISKSEPITKGALVKLFNQTIKKYRNLKK